MKPWTDALVVVTASAGGAGADQCLRTWHDTAAFRWRLIVVDNGRAGATGRPFLGSVPAFAEGMEWAATPASAQVIAALHDDLEILEPGWDAQVIAHFASRPACGLAGFSGATGIGRMDLYQTPYEPVQLAREGFLSNLTNAEDHGRRETTARQVLCHDGFSLIGRRAWWIAGELGPYQQAPRGVQYPPPWTYLRDRGVRHHAYDTWMGLLAYQCGWESWYLPIRCHHQGGQTAVANPGYHEWAQQFGGDQGIWEDAHKKLYEAGRGWLPLRLEGEERSRV